jgi:shikimate kinase
LTRDPNIVLIGFMGSGKTVVGRALGRRLGREVVDLDDVIVTAGGPVAALFAAEGERAFRRRERQALVQVLARGGQVVSVGGGAPMAPENWRRIRRGNRVVALTASPEERRCRLRDDGTRPLLARGEAAVRALEQKRRSRYRQADLVLDTSYRTVEEVAEAIAVWVEKR